jgi:hypothetical protein
VVAAVAVLLMSLPPGNKTATVSQSNRGGQAAGTGSSLTDTPTRDASPSGRVDSSPPAPPLNPTASPMPGPPQVFAPVTFEAEAADNTLSGSAFLTRYPGASNNVIVRNIGDWGDAAGPGVLTFNRVIVPIDGVYALTFRHVNLDNEASRSVVITVPGELPITTTVSSGSTCCETATVSVRLQEGLNTITFANPFGHAPSLDSITIALP